MGGGEFPFNFKERFGIDYSSMKPTKLRIDEMNRFCYWLKLPYSGSVFGTEVLSKNDNIVMKFVLGINIKTMNMIADSRMFKFLEDFDTKYTISDILNFLINPYVELEGLNNDYYAFTKWLAVNYGYQTKFTLGEIFRAYFIFKYYNKFKSQPNPRVVPLMMFEPHLNAPERRMYFPLIASFKYHMLLGSVRNPLTVIGRFYETSSKSNHGAGYIALFMILEYFTPENIREEFINNWYLYRFEDLKQYPRETLNEICKYLDVPFDEKMLEDESKDHKADGVVRGFDKAPLNRKLDFAFSKLDEARMQILFNPLLKYFGYETFDDEGCPISENDFANMLKFPFKFENHFIKNSGMNEAEKVNFRNFLRGNMFNLWRRAIKGEMIMPQLIKPKIEEVIE